MIISIKQHIWKHCFGEIHSDGVIQVEHVELNEFLEIIADIQDAGWAVKVVRENEMISDQVAALKVLQRNISPKSNCLLLKVGHAGMFRIWSMCLTRLTGTRMSMWTEWWVTKIDNSTTELEQWSKLATRKHALNMKYHNDYVGKTEELFEV